MPRRGAVGVAMCTVSRSPGVYVVTVLVVCVGVAEQAEVGVCEDCTRLCQSVLMYQSSY